LEATSNLVAKILHQLQGLVHFVSTEWRSVNRKSLVEELNLTCSYVVLHGFCQNLLICYSEHFLNPYPFRPRPWKTNYTWLPNTSFIRML